MLAVRLVCISPSIQSYPSDHPFWRFSAFLSVNFLLLFRSHHLATLRSLVLYQGRVSKMDWNTVEKQISVDDLNKWDWKASADKLRVLESGALTLANGHGEPAHYALSDHAASQLCQR